MSYWEALYGKETRYNPTKGCQYLKGIFFTSIEFMSASTQHIEANIFAPYNYGYGQGSQFQMELAHDDNKVFNYPP